MAGGGVRNVAGNNHPRKTKNSHLNILFTLIQRRYPPGQRRFFQHLVTGNFSLAPEILDQRIDFIFTAFCDKG